MGSPRLARVRTGRRARSVELRTSTSSGPPSASSITVYTLVRTCLPAEHEVTEQRPAPRVAELLDRAVPERFTRAHRRAHRGESFGGAVGAHVALHHLVEIGDVLGNPERAGEHAVGAADAARLERGLHDAVLGLLDRVGRAHLRAGRVLAVHAHHRCRLCARGTVDAFEVDQRLTAVRAAFGARLNARFAADASALVDHEHRVGRRCRTVPFSWLIPVQFHVAGVGGVGVPAGALDAHGGDLELGHLRQRVDGPVGQLVRGLVRRASGRG